MWDNENILVETNASDVIQAVYSQEPIVFGNLVSQYRSATTSLFHFDALGSTDRLTNTSGTVTDSYVYKAFGIIVANSGSTVNAFSYIGRSGYQYCSDIGQHYLRRRHYIPALARFSSRDPLGHVDGPNLYVYVANMPTSLVDPTGQQIIGLALQYCRCCINAYLICRPLGSLLGKRPWIAGVGPRPARHCFVYWSNSCANDGRGQAHSYSLFPVGIWPTWEGVPAVDDPRDHPWPAEGPGPTPADWPPAEWTYKKCNGCVTEDCLATATQNYPVGDYDLPGPNSNTFAFTIFRQCCSGGSSDWTPPWTGSAPGLDDKPPKPTE